LLLRNKAKRVIILFAVITVGINISCDNDPEPISVAELSDQSRLIEFVQKEINPKLEHAFYGRFGIDTTKKIIVAEEISNPKEWGIKFQLYELDEDTVKKVYETALLEGSLQESQILKTKFPGKKYNVIYYNSGSFFMGSGGGEVFAYLIDFEKRRVNYGHLVLSRQIYMGLFLSPSNEREVSDFITSEFKRDYPRLKVIQKDYELE